MRDALEPLSLTRAIKLEVELPYVTEAMRRVEEGVARLESRALVTGWACRVNFPTSRTGATTAQPSRLPGGWDRSKEGVTLEDQILITQTGALRTSFYPFDDRLGTRMI